MLWRSTQDYEVKLDNSDPADFRRRFIDCLDQGLRDRRAGEIRTERYTLRFSGTFLRPFVLAGGSLNWIDDGRVQVYTDDAGASVECSIVTRKLHLFCILVSGLALVGSIVGITLGKADPRDLFTILVMYFLLVTVLSGYTRLRWFLLVRSCIKAAQK